MATELRKTGISVIGDIPWGTHFCGFYDTSDDLLDILVPYFKSGLESKEFCLWVISNSELLSIEEAMSALRNALPGLDPYLIDRSIEIVGHDDWFLNGETFDLHKVANRFREKLNEALARGYAGMRINGSPAWLHDEGQKELCKFEEELDKLFPNERIIASCTYPLAGIGGDEIFDMVRTHQFAIARRQREWGGIETPELVQAKTEIKRLNEELEQRVVERTRELAATNEELIREIIERKRAEGALRRQHEILQKIFDNIPVMIALVGKEGDVELVNREWERTTGWTRDEIHERHLDPFVECFSDPQYRQTFRDFVTTANGEWADFKLKVRDGRVIDMFFEVVCLSNGTRLGIGRNITERKRAEQQLKQSERQLAEAQHMASVGSWNWDLQSNAVNWSDELYRIFGVDPQAFNPADADVVMELIHAEDRDLVRDVFQSSIKTQKPCSFCYRLLRPDGEERVVHSRADIVSDERGNPIRMFGTVQDVTERKQAEKRLRATTEQLRAFSARLQSAREEEGTRIAREIHNELGSVLTSLKWDLEGTEKIFASPVEPSQFAALRERLHALIKLTDLAISAIRRIASELRPSVLDDLGLVAAIEWLAQQFQARTEIVCYCDCSLEKVELSEEQSTAVFRILQEALTNVLHHAQATRVEIKINKENSDFTLSIRDNGKGITESEKSEQQSLGILGMRERAHLVGGEIDIKGAEGKGTVVIVRVPMSDQDRVLEMTR